MRHCIHDNGLGVFANGTVLWSWVLSSYLGNFQGSQHPHCWIGWLVWDGLTEGGWVWKGARRVELQQSKSWIGNATKKKIWVSSKHFDQSKLSPFPLDVFYFPAFVYFSFLFITQMSRLTTHQIVDASNTVKYVQNMNTTVI